MINVLVLMSGPSEAFKDAGFAYPKNLIEIGGQSMVQRVLDHLLTFKILDAQFVCVLRREENRKYHTAAVIHLVESAAKIVEVNSTTTGAACSALLAVEFINNSEPLIIVNGDQLLFEINLPKIVVGFQQQNLDGGIIVFQDIHPRWSFVKCDTNGLVIETAEKRPISNLATAGFYYFARGSDFVDATTEMIKKNAQVNGQFYICPAYNELILRQRRIGVHVINKSSYQSLATPSDVPILEAKITKN